MTALDHFFVRDLRFLQRPMPGILKGRDLSRRLLPGLVLLEEDVVAGVGIERRVQVDQIDAFGWYVLAQHIEVIAEEELVLPGVHREQPPYTNTLAPIVKRPLAAPGCRPTPRCSAAASSASRTARRVACKCRPVLSAAFPRSRGQPRCGRCEAPI